MAVSQYLPPQTPTHPLVYLPSSLFQGCHQGSPKHLSSLAPGQVMIPSSLHPALCVHGVALRHPSGIFHQLLFLPFDVKRVGDLAILLFSCQAETGPNPFPPECHTYLYRPWNTALRIHLPLPTAFFPRGWLVCSYFPFLSTSLCPPPADTPHLYSESVPSLDAQPWERPGNADSDTVCQSLLSRHEPHQTGCYTDAVFLLMSWHSPRLPDSQGRQQSPSLGFSAVVWVGCTESWDLLLGSLANSLTANSIVPLAF